MCLCETVQLNPMIDSNDTTFMPHCQFTFIFSFQFGFFFHYFRFKIETKSTHERFPNKNMSKQIKMIAFTLDFIRNEGKTQKLICHHHQCSSNDTNVARRYGIYGWLTAQSARRQFTINVMPREQKKSRKLEQNEMKNKQHESSK